MSRTLCIFKPDLACNRHDVAHALLRLLAVDLVPTALQFVDITVPQAARLSTLRTRGNRTTAATLIS